MRYIGIDPGKSGGIAWLDVLEKGKTISCVKMPGTITELWDTLSEVVLDAPFVPTDDDCLPCYCCLEKVGGYVAQKGAQPGASMFKFGQGFGQLQMALTALACPYEEVAPRTWLDKFALAKGKQETEVAWKNRHKDAARKLFPEAHANGGLTHSTADALLLARYAQIVSPV